MAAQIEKAVGVVPELRKGQGGVFEVELNGRLIYSKKQTGRFPAHQEILSQLGA